MHCLKQSKKTKQQMRRKLAERKRSAGWPAWLPKWPALLSTLPIATVTLTLIGYGYDLAYLGEFGLSPQTVQHGPLDFLLRATYGLLPLIDTSNSLKELLSTTEGLARIWGDSEWVRYVGAAVALTLLLLAIASKEFSSDAPFRSQRLLRTIGRARKVSAGVALVLGRISRAWRFVLGFAAAGWLSPPVLFYLIGAALWLVGALLLLALTAAPIIGIKAGKIHAREHVIDPARCVQKTGDGQLIRDGASCVRVIKDGRELARGRLIDQTGNRVWLLRKHPWSVTSVPLDGAVVEYTDNEASI